MASTTLNGPQTTGRDYRHLSEPTHRIHHDYDIAVAMRDGVDLLADVHRPDADGRFPVLIAASPYPRQIQNLGAPMGFVEAGDTEFWVTRGYVHLIVNLRGTCGSGGEFGFFDTQERRDMYDLVEWAAAQSWSDGNVGMMGISYFAMTQLEAAVERPPHLKAIFPLAVTADLYEAATHHGLASSSFITPFLSMVGLTSGRSSAFWRSLPMELARKVLHAPPLHRRFGTMNGEAAVTVLRQMLKLPHDPHPWDDLWLDVMVKHPVRDAWWDERDLTGVLERIDVPVYLGCDWENVPLHLPSTFVAWKALAHNPNVRMGLLGQHGLTWPWESLHTEALAWYDHWLKGHDTGIMDGPPIRYVLPGGDGWRVADQWPPAEATLTEWALRADGVLAVDEGTPGTRELMVLGSGLGRVKPSPVDPPALLSWTSAPLPATLDVVGELELRLVASATAVDTAWLVTLTHVAADGTANDVTAGWLRASLREVDEAASTSGAPVLPCRSAAAVPPGEAVHYRIPLVANARRFATGDRIRVTVTSDDQDPKTPAIMGFRHASVGTSSVNTIASSSRLVVPALPADDAGTNR